MASSKAIGTTARVEDTEVEGTSERSSLLGAGASRDDQPLVRISSWDGLDDFKGEPWWRKPSVCSFP